MLFFRCRYNYETDMHAFQEVRICFITIFVTVSIFISGHFKRNFRFTTSKDIYRIVSLWQLLYCTVYNFVAHLPCPTLHSSKQAKNPRLMFTFKLQESSVYGKRVRGNLQFNYFRNQEKHTQNYTFYHFIRNNSKWVMKKLIHWVWWIFQNFFMKICSPTNSKTSAELLYTGQK